MSVAKKIEIALPSRQLILVIYCCLVSGCSTLQYYSESIAGQWEVISKRQDISHLIQNEDTPAKLRSKLTLASNLREFAFTHLQLPDNGSYRSYVDLKRPFVVWNVFATGELSLKPHLSCFPFVGCLSYRGFFSAQSANNYAAELSTQGMDTYLGGVAAYSTLGWFRDPVLNTMLNWSDTRLAEVLFHELAHQKIYITDDSDFNEAFATTVGRHGVSQWLSVNQQANLIETYQMEEERHLAFITLLLAAREALKKTYDSDLSEEHKRTSKSLIFSRLELDYRTLKNSWGGYTGYDRWMETDLNNAKLLSIATYQSLVPYFQQLLRNCAHELNCFYQRVEILGKLDINRRHECLKQQTHPVSLRSTDCRLEE